MGPASSRASLGKAAVAVAVMALAACTPGNMLKWNQVDARAVVKGEAGVEKFNAIRVATFGPHAEQIYGYFLYRDGFEVVTDGGASIERLGKLTMGEVAADYAGVVKRNMYGPRTLVTREIYRGGGVIGYTITDLKLDAYLWDITPSGQESKPVLRLEYEDRRTFKNDGDGRGIPDSLH